MLGNKQLLDSIFDELEKECAMNMAAFVSKNEEFQNKNYVLKNIKLLKFIKNNSLKEIYTSHKETSEDSQIRVKYERGRFFKFPRTQDDTGSYVRARKKVELAKTGDSLHVTEKRVRPQSL